MDPADPTATELPRAGVVSKLRRLEQHSAVRFVLQAAVGFPLNIALTVLFHEVVGLHEELAFFASLAIVFVINFMIMRHYVYRAQDGHRGGQMVRFACTSASFRAIEYLAFLVVHTALNAPYLPAMIGILITSFVAKYFVFKRLVFRKSGSTTEAEAATG